MLRIKGLSKQFVGGLSAQRAVENVSVDVPIEIDLVLAAFVIAVLIGFLATLTGTLFPAWRA